MDENKLNSETMCNSDDLLESVVGGERKFVIYIVQHGDNLRKIADYFGVSDREIYLCNKQVIGNVKGQIIPGTRLRIPL